MKKYGSLAFLSALIMGFGLSCIWSNDKNATLKNVNNTESYKTEIRDFSDFTKLDASGSLNIVVIVGKDFKVELESDEKALNEIETKIDGDTLKIFSKKDWSSSKNQVAVRISLPNLQGVEISGTSNGVISNVKSDDFSMTLNGSSSVKIGGETKNLNLIANGASKIEADDLKTENIVIEMNGSSTANVYASNVLNAKAYGASNVSFIGNPKKVEKETTGISSIRER
jgi:Putative auto-transporter adhesin, head GIN domain